MTVPAIGLCIVLFGVWFSEVIGYILFLPEPAPSPVRDHPWLKHTGTIVYGISYSLSLLRAPLGLFPYMFKVWLQLGLRIGYEARRTTYLREVLNMFGELTNLLLTWLLVRSVIGPARPQWWVILCYLPLWAESIRLLAERIPILFSAVWQLTPHRRIAEYVQQHFQVILAWNVVRRYCRYYCLSDADRAAYILGTLKHLASSDPDVADRLAYLHAFRIVPPTQGLRGGLVRNVAKGEVFVHASWTADPWLLIGMALRRSPWPFDPRYLRRPFYYMSEANRVTSLFVLQHARYTLPYALFQFGHEIRVARLHCFYVLLRWLGADIERKVWADGTFQNDQGIAWLKQRLGYTSDMNEPGPLYNDSEVLLELEQKISTDPTALEIAEHYMYPLKYVEEVLLPLIVRQKEARDELPVSL